MIAELGNFCLALALAISLILGVYPLISRQMLMIARPLSFSLLAVVLVAFICLTSCFIFNDFSLVYVANNSNSQLPIYYRIAAVWGAHEGSLLLWVFLFALWTAAVAAFSRKMPIEQLATVLAVMGLINSGFLAFIIFTSNPFLRTLPNFPIDGRDLNPLLQDIGLILHPPLLYMGYVGFAVAFAFAIASLLHQRLDTAWIRWTRCWTLAAWCFLSLGILLGAGWAYYELGWGGWWFWDPVENASLMPWLTGTALLHSLVVTEKRAAFKAWTILLAITTFSLCLMGTFLVRSGILVSVHAFAADASRGSFILVYLLLVVGCSLLLFATRAGQLRSRTQYSLFSRESLLLGNNILLFTATLVVLLGTLLPLVHKQLGLGSISIGAPFFNIIFSWLMLPFSLLLGVAPLVRWRRDQPRRLTRPVLLALICAAILAVALPLCFNDQLWVYTLLGLWMGFTIIGLIIFDIYTKAKHKDDLLQGIKKLSLNYWGMTTTHLGLAIMVFGIAVSQNYSIERHVRLKVGEQVEIKGYQFKLTDIDSISRSNYQGTLGKIEVTSPAQKTIFLQAEKRQYTVSRMLMTEAAISSNWQRDLYAALGEQISEQGDWSLRLYYKPLMSWIWYGGVLMVIGALLCLIRRGRTA